MTRHKHKQSRTKLLRSLYIWHRYIGLAAALFVILLAITGLALNHTEELALDSRHVQSSALLDWYGIHAPEQMTSYAAGAHIITAVGDHLYWNTQRIAEVTAPLLGAVKLPELVVVGAGSQLALFTLEGELLEQLGGATGVPAGMQAIGLTASGKLAIRAAHGVYWTDENFLEWHETAGLQAAWASSTATPGQLRQALKEIYRGSGLPLERVLLDLHSGRILGGWGVYLMDAAAILFLMLAFSGLWLWGKRRASARRHRQHLESKQKHADTDVAFKKVTVPEGQSPV